VNGILHISPAVGAQRRDLHSHRWHRRRPSLAPRVAGTALQATAAAAKPSAYRRGRRCAPPRQRRKTHASACQITRAHGGSRREGKGIFGREGRAAWTGEDGVRGQAASCPLSLERTRHLLSSLILCVRGCCSRRRRHSAGLRAQDVPLAVLLSSTGVLAVGLRW